jgi:ABC-type multidrug transport system ATPase subunit
VDGLSFTVRPGHVTGFLGPNGAGKTTTMRVILGLDAPTSGHARVNSKALAADGRTVLVSSDLMSEMAQTADRLIIIGRGRLLADTTTAELIESSARKDVLVRSPRAAELADLIKARGAWSRARSTRSSSGASWPATRSCSPSRPAQRWPVPWTWPAWPTSRSWLPGATPTARR